MTSESKIWIPGQYCNHCLYDDGSYRWDDDDYCMCPGDPVVIWTVVDIRVPEKPIIHKPNDVDFNIRIWCLEVLDSETDHCNLDNHDLTAEFSLSSTIDPVDLEIKYKDYVKRYLSDLKTDQVNISQSFRAPCPAHSYIAAINKILHSIVNPPQAREQEENPHIERRKKKGKGKDKKSP